MKSRNQNPLPYRLATPLHRKRMQKSPKHRFLKMEEINKRAVLHCLILQYGKTVNKADNRNDKIPTPTALDSQGE